MKHFDIEEKGKLIRYKNFTTTMEDWCSIKINLRNSGKHSKLKSKKLL